jgi:hypothetical protein
MQLLTKAIRRQLPALYAKEEQGTDALAIVKFFTPDSRLCTCSLRLIQQPAKPGKMPSLQHVYEGVLPWYRICSSTSSR